MDLFTITVAGLAGVALGGGIADFLNRKLRNAHEGLIAEQRDYIEDLRDTLATLRRNAFITNSKGHRVRYSNATAEERAKAEGAV